MNSIISLDRMGRWIMVLAVLFSGCSAGAVETTRLTGKVTVNGVPATSGAIAFYGPQNYVASSYINPDGTYEIENVPLGDVRVTVVTSPPISDGSGPNPANMTVVARKKVPTTRVPTKYATPDNDLRFNVTSGMTKNFDLR